MTIPPGDDPVNIAATLTERSRAQPDVAALVQPWGTQQPTPAGERRWTYRELDAESDRLARGLERIGLARGMRTVLMVPPSLEFYSLTFALFKLGAVVVLIDPGMGVANLGVCLGEAAPEAFIGVPKAHLGRILLGWGRKTIRIRVTVGRRLWRGWTLAGVRKLGEEGDPVLTPTRAEEIAAILFTSGSTGVAKGAVYTHGNFTGQVAILRQTYGIEPGEVDLPTFPLFGLFGPALGMTGILPEMDATRPARVDPRCILNVVRHYRVTNLFGSPALLRRVGFAPEAEGVQLPSLRRVISAGAPVPASVIRQFSRLLQPEARIHTPYGATEALPVATISSEEILGETAAETVQGKGVCVGRPVAGMSVKVITLRDDALPTWTADLEAPPGTIGEIVVSGPVVTRSYHQRPESTALHKIADPDRGTFWHRMGDVGYLDATGRLWFCGRKSQRVTTEEGTLFTIPVEGVFNAHPLVHRSALVGVNRGGKTVPVVCIEPEGSRVVEAQRAIADGRFVAELRELGAAWPHTQGIQHFLFHPAFPVDIRHNAKIFREKLAVWAEGELTRRGETG